MNSSDEEPGDAPDVATELGDLSGVSLADLFTMSADDLDGMPGRYAHRLATRGASISGYNGASGLSGDAKAHVIPER